MADVGQRRKKIMAPKENAPYGQIDADTHQTTLDLLKDVADYLSRLPAHPMTNTMLKKVQAHLNNPSAKAQEARLSMLAKDQTLSAKVMSGDGFKGMSRFTTDGLPLIAARLLYPALRLESPAVQWHLNAGEKLEAESIMAEIGREIAGGVSMDFSPIHPIIDRAWINPQYFFKPK